jgi:putative transposase
VQKQHCKAQILACDFFTVEPFFFQTVYILFFIELQTRQVYVAGCTAHPNWQWVTQQAQQMVWQIEEPQPTIHFLIHDHDSKFVSTFDTVFRAIQAHIILTPFRAPSANACAERWVKTVRLECLNKLIILNEAHLRKVLHNYVMFHSEGHPHQGLDQQTPIPMRPIARGGAVRSRLILGDIICDPYRAA